MNEEKKVEMTDKVIRIAGVLWVVILPIVVGLLIVLTIIVFINEGTVDTIYTFNKYIGKNILLKIGYFALAILEALSAI